MVQKTKENKKPLKKQPPPKQRQGPANSEKPQQGAPIDLSPLPLPLQQLLLDTFKSALLPTNPHNSGNSESGPESLDLKPLIQRIKTHLYNRDFDSAFTEADEDVLRAYALRWSAGRALGYAGLFRGVFELLPGGETRGRKSRGRIVCVGGGGGAEIAALAAVWRDLMDSDSGSGSGSEETRQRRQVGDGISITAVDIADWSGVVQRLDASIRCADVAAAATAGSSICRAPLVHDLAGDGFKVGFKRADVLDLSETELGELFGTVDNHAPHASPFGGNGSQSEPETESTVLVTLMFTLNELFSTSMAKATGFLLRMTDSLLSGTVLLVVDSPGSYSTLRLGKGNGEEKQERRYPMKFLLDHTLLSVARGKWESVFSQDSRWWRRDAARLQYDVGEGAGLEDMRFQVHIYRRVGS